MLLTDIKYHYHRCHHYTVNCTNSRTQYSQAPEIETADLSQSHAGLNLSQFQTDCLLRINHSKAILNDFELFESILGIATTLT